MPAPIEDADQIKQEVCNLIAEGRSVNSIAAMEGMPHRATIYRWLNDDPNFVATYTRAREQQADKLAEEIVEIADTEADPNRARVRIDARKWVAAKLKAKTYGDKVAHTGADGESPVAMVITWQTAESSGS